MTRCENTIFCDGCGAEINWSPVLFRGGEYCCQDCAERRACRCGERMDWEDERRAHAIEGGAGGESESRPA